MLLSMNSTAGLREVSYAVEDAAYQAASKLAEDPRAEKEIKRIAFVKLWVEDSTNSIPNSDGLVAVFESALGAVPAPFNIVLHSNRDQQWAMIDSVFDQVADFDDYNPATLPQLNKLEICDTLLLAKLINWIDGGDNGVSSVRIALKAIQVKSARQIWSAVIEGTYDGCSAPDNEKLSYFSRKALEAAAADAVAKLPASLDGYGVLVAPLQGTGGKALTQIFMNALTAAGKQDKIRLYDLPNGNAADRMLGRYLWERTGSGKTLDPSALKQIKSKAGADGKLALMTGMVVTGRVYPETWVDPTGAPVDRLTGSYSDIRKNPTSFEIVADLKFRDVNDAFRVVAAVSANGVYKRDVGEEVTEQFRSFLTVRNIVVAAVVLILIWFVCKFTLRVR